jgi:hypothetical protein
LISRLRSATISGGVATPNHELASKARTNSLTLGMSHCASRKRGGHATEQHMRGALLLALIAALSCRVADAREIRRDAIPEAFQGTWATSTGACKDGDKSPIVLSATSYAGPAGSCVIDYVMEVPGRGGAIYSARMHCSGSQPEAKTIANLIIRPGNDGQISLGPTFESLVAHRRCPAAEPPK